MTPTLVMAAHGARSGHWESVMDSLAARVRRARPGAPVELGFLEISAPLLSDVLSRVAGPVVVVPCCSPGDTTRTSTCRPSSPAPGPTRSSPGSSDRTGC
ncbi:sirohydrochlorin chelatase [Microbispora siamensis]